MYSIREMVESTNRPYDDEMELINQENLSLVGYEPALKLHMDDADETHIAEHTNFLKEHKKDLSHRGVYLMNEHIDAHGKQLKIKNRMGNTVSSFKKKPPIVRTAVEPSADGG